MHSQVRALTTIPLFEDEGWGGGGGLLHCTQRVCEHVSVLAVSLPSRNSCSASHVSESSFE